MVISALEQAVGAERIRWETAALPDETSVELRVTYDPVQLDAESIVTAVQAAMEAHPDPAHPGPVRMLWRRP